MKSISKTLPFLAALTLVALMAIPTYAQTAAATGKVTGLDGKPAAVGTIIFIDRQDVLGLNYKVKTDKYGEFFYNGLPTGMYKYSVMECVDPAKYVDCKPIMSIEKKLAFLDPNQNEENAVDLDLRKAPKAGSAEEMAMLDGMDAMKKKIDDQNKAGQGYTDLFNKGVKAFQEKQYEQAAEFFKQASAKDPKQPLAVANYAIALNSLKKYDESVVAFRKAIEIKPDNPKNGDYYYEIGMTLRRAQKVDDSIEAFKKAAEVSPALGGKAYYSVGEALDVAVRNAESLAAFEKSVELDPKYADSYFKIALTKFGDPSKIKDAIPLLNQYLKLAPTGEFADPAKGLLEAAKSEGGPTQYTSPQAQKEAEEKAAKDKAAKEKADAAKAKNKNRE